MKNIIDRINALPANLRPYPGSLVSADRVAGRETRVYSGQFYAAVREVARLDTVRSQWTVTVKTLDDDQRVSRTGQAAGRKVAERDADRALLELTVQLGEARVK